MLLLLLDWLAYAHHMIWLVLHGELLLLLMMRALARQGALALLIAAAAWAAAARALDINEGRREVFCGCMWVVHLVATWSYNCCGRGLEYPLCMWKVGVMLMGLLLCAIGLGGYLNRRMLIRF